MNKTDLIKMVAEKANKPTKEVAEIIDSFSKNYLKSKRKRCFYKRFWYFQKDYSASSDS